MKIGDLSADRLADRQKRPNRIAQKTMPVDQLFSPMAEHGTAHLADDQTVVLQQTPDLIFEIAFHLDQQSAAVQHRPDLMTRDPLDPDFLVPTTLHDPGQSHGIIAVGLVDLQ